MVATVLVAEDNDDYRTVLRLLLTSLRCTVVEACNGLEAIAIAESSHPDLIIMDWKMPQLGGLEAAKRLKENPTTKAIPIVICTALSREALGQTNLLDCAQEIIQKPVHLQKLAELVRKYGPRNNQPPVSFPVNDEQHGANVLEAWRAVRNLKQAISEDSPRGRSLETHNFNKRPNDSRLSSREQSRELISTLLLRASGGKLFAAFVEGSSICAELLSMA
jgi:CheY-like chemotaxis protein